MVDATPWIQPAYKLFQASSHPCEFLSGYHAVLGDWTKERLRIQAPDSSCLAPGCFILKQRDSLAPQITLWITLFVLYPHQGKDAAFLFLPSIQDLCGAQVRSGEACLPCLYCWVKNKIWAEMSHTVWSRCASVWTISGDLRMNSFAWLSFFCYFQHGLSTFFLTCLCKHVAYLLWVCIFSFFLFFSNILIEHVVYLLWVDIFYFLFCIAQVVLESKVIEFLFLWMDVATISQYGSIVCVRDLDQESMTSF